MQILFRAFLAIYLAHLLTDFVFQTHHLVEQKRRGKPFAYFLHGLTHYLSAIILVSFFLAGSGLSFRTHAVILALTLVHLLIDFAKIRSLMDFAKIQFIKKSLLSDGAIAYLSDQFFHFLSVALAAWLLSPGLPFAEVAALLGRGRDLPNKLLFVPVIYIGVIFGGGYLIRALTRPLARSINLEQPEKGGEPMQNAGLYIGWLERFLLLTALLLQSPGTAGLILAAKAIARYPEFKSEHFAEYFLIGTLLSFSIAVLGGAVLAKLVLGQFHIAG
ncbi:MAG TPA: DUF3307 domain-containing protein [Candidatus Acidoferrum sp.]|nr:DUF3307 domain-containing protein [Candidatus Acidoferrum sp.]